MSGIGIIAGFLFYILPLVIAVFVVVWIYQMKTNSEEQVRQNKKIIGLLEELKNK